MIDRARREVLGELERTGLATAELLKVRVTRPWVQLDERVGLYRPDSRGGTIAVPALSLGRLPEYRGDAPWTSVRDILRHEYAHALADHHPALVECAGFERAFGAPHDDERPAGEYSHDAHVSVYAATMPSEDFAETAMLYFRALGRIERFRARKQLYRKLRFMDACRDRLAGADVSDAAWAA